MAATTRSRRHANEERTLAELVTLGISIVLLVGLVGTLAWLDLRSGDERVRIDVRPEFARAYEHDGVWYLPVTITNVGDRATDLLRVELTNTAAGDDQPEVAEFEYAFVSGGERVRGTAIFDAQPTRDSVQVDEIAITEP
jgi:uncharacterized protein (TIGR02588 family)